VFKEIADSAHRLSQLLQIVIIVIIIIILIVSAVLAGNRTRGFWVSAAPRNSRAAVDARCSC